MSNDEVTISILGAIGVGTVLVNLGIYFGLFRSELKNVASENKVLKMQLERLDDKIEHKVQEQHIKMRTALNAMSERQDIMNNYVVKYGENIKGLESDVKRVELAMDKNHNEVKDTLRELNNNLLDFIKR